MSVKRFLSNDLYIKLADIFTFDLESVGARVITGSGIILIQTLWFSKRKKTKRVVKSLDTVPPLLLRRLRIVSILTKQCYSRSKYDRFTLVQRGYFLSNEVNLIETRISSFIVQKLNKPTFGVRDRRPCLLFNLL